MRQIDIDEVSARIYSDIKGLLANFKTDQLPLGKEILQDRIEEYLEGAHQNGDIYFIPQVRVGPKIYRHIDPNDENTVNELVEKNSVSLEFYDPKTGCKIQAIDELVTPAAKFSATEQ